MRFVVYGLASLKDAALGFKYPADCALFKQARTFAQLSTVLKPACGHKSFLFLRYLRSACLEIRLVGA